MNLGFLYQGELNLIFPMAVITLSRARKRVDIEVGITPYHNHHARYENGVDQMPREWEYYSGEK